MTIPNLMANYQHKRLKTQFKKMNAQLGQISYKLQSEGIACATSQQNYRNEGKLFHEFLLSNFKVLDKIPPNQSPYKSFKTYTLKESDSKIYPNCFDNFYGCEYNQYIYTLADGTNIATGTHDTVGHLISVDINGVNHGPNAFGHDLFFYKVDTSTCRIIPMTGQWRIAKEDDSERAQEIGYLWTDGYCSKTSNSQENGFVCAQYAIQDKDPNGSAKGYFEALPK